jgi:arabinose-5-phosphate isomerase
VPVLALTADPDSTLARRADLVLDARVPAEACPHDLAPTASSTAAMALGDALAIALLERRNFSPEDFARLHPGGELGRRLLWTVGDVMVTGEQLPRVGPDDDLARATHEIAHRRGTVPVVDADGRVIGVLTAGDLMRFADTRPDFLRHPVRDAMNQRPRTTGPEEMATEALARMERDGIMALPVVGAAGRLVGIVHLHDLLRAGLA